MDEMELDDTGARATEQNDPVNPKLLDRIKTVSDFFASGCHKAIEMENTPEMSAAKHSLTQASKIVQHACTFVKKLQQPSPLHADDTAREAFLSEVHTLASRTLKSAANWNIIMESSEKSFNEAVERKLSDQQDKNRYFELKGLAPWGQALEHLSPGHAGLEIFGTPVEPLNYPHLTYQTIPWDGLILADDWDEEVLDLMESIGVLPDVDEVEMYPEKEFMLTAREQAAPDPYFYELLEGVRGPNEQKNQVSLLRLPQILELFEELEEGMEPLELTEREEILCLLRRLPRGYKEDIDESEESHSDGEYEVHTLEDTTYEYGDIRRSLVPFEGNKVSTTSDEPL